jgi:hypothetical protein
MAVFCTSQPLLDRQPGTLSYIVWKQKLELVRIMFAIFYLTSNGGYWGNIPKMRTFGTILKFCRKEHGLRQYVHGFQVLINLLYKLTKRKLE